jgi:hypothetical protein
MECAAGACFKKSGSVRLRLMGRFIGAYRIEKDGTCSLESSQALAAVFETRVASIQLDTDKEIRESRIRRFQFWGSFGNTAGVICAFAGISYSFYIGNLQGLEAGLWYSGIAVLSGLLYLANLLLSAYFRNSRIF